MVLPPDCLRCVHYHRDARRLTCAAFPKGIPTAIIRGREHIRPYSGDGGLRFELDPRAPAPRGPNDPLPVYRRNVRVDE